jgi:hypothetical protein
MGSWDTYVIFLLYFPVAAVPTDNKQLGQVKQFSRKFYIDTRKMFMAK